MPKLNGTIFDYTDKYFMLYSTYTRKQLYELQDSIVAIIKNGSRDIKKELNSDIDNFHINYILKLCHDRNLVKRVKIGNEWVARDSVYSDRGKNKKISVYKYFT